MREQKILFTGTMGAGKTTAISAISDIPPIVTDVQNNDLSVDKQTTTVGLDYGEVSLGSGERLRLYGTPGQQRFAFMWQVLAKGALGLVILIDNSRPAPLEDLQIYLTNFAELIRDTACVIGVGRLDTHASPDLDAYADTVMQLGSIIPVVACDVRNREEVLLLLDLLLMQLESKEEINEH